MSTASTVARPAGPLDVIALQYANPTRMVTIPLVILSAVVAVTSVVTALVVQGGGTAHDMESNGSVLWSTLGFIVAVGVQVVAVSFPLALALGSTRRTFTAGVLATAALEAALLTLAALVLLGLEVLTGGWFVGARVLGDATLGGGDPLALAAVMFLAVLTAIVAGGLFGAAWVRFGARGPLVLGVGIATAAVLALLVLAPSLESAARGFQGWWLAVAALVVVAVSTAGTLLLLRRAAVR